MNDIDTEKLSAKNYILIKGARIHNLKNISLAIPKNKFIVITGLSGSGKSSLAFDTIYAEGQRRYVESLSSYARQFLGRMGKPEVDDIKGIAPAIAIEQKVNTRNPRSTVGISTEIYEYLKLLYARIGKTCSPVSGEQVKRHSPDDVATFISGLSENTGITIYAPLKQKGERSFNAQLNILLQQGFSRISVKGEIFRIDDFLATSQDNGWLADCLIVIDRFTVNKEDEDLHSRITDSVQTAFYEGSGVCILGISSSGMQEYKEFSNRFEMDGIVFEEPSVNLFSFNNPYGACKRCEGFGSIIGIDEDMVVPDKSLSIYDHAIACWRGDKMSEWRDQLVMNAYKFDFPIHKPFFELTESEKQLLWTGNHYFGGLNDFFRYVEEQSYKIQYRVMMSRYRGKTTCPECKGTRLRMDAGYVLVNGKSVIDLVRMPVTEVLDFFRKIQLTAFEVTVAKRLLIEITNRLQFMIDVGLGYLTLNRLSSSLSGGESQRINLSSSLGSSLVGSLYILDEPSIGLHPRDTDRLIKVLKKLRDIGNTVIVVEHDENIIRAADRIIDIGPLAGEHGGEIVFEGNFNELVNNGQCMTSLYLSGRKKIELPSVRRKWKDYIQVTGARENNLKNIHVKFPLGIFTVVTGVSGSGKTSLVKKILYTALKKNFGGTSEKTGKFDRIEGDINRITDIELIDQNPIGRSTRSNPATYVKAYDDIRGLFAEQQLARLRGFKPGFFSFNIEGGRCEECLGEGVVKIEMQFMADVYLTCEGCGGKRFREEVLEIQYNGKTISDVLEMTISAAIEFFSEKGSSYSKRIIEKLKPLEEVGLGYLRMGQPSSTLSGGEAQRIKLASFLSRGSNEKPVLFIFDEPTTGLHFHDINKLLVAFNKLIEKGHTIIVIEHNPDVIKCADHIIDLGPEGGESGGNVVFEGTPEGLKHCRQSYTAKFIKNALSGYIN